MVRTYLNGNYQVSVGVSLSLLYHFLTKMNTNRFYDTQGAPYDSSNPQ